jgi:hypothetical protein
MPYDRSVASDLGEQPAGLDDPPHPFCGLLCFDKLPYQPRQYGALTAHLKRTR